MKKQFHFTSKQVAKNLLDSLRASGHFDPVDYREMIKTHDLNMKLEIIHNGDIESDFKLTLELFPKGTLAA